MTQRSSEPAILVLSDGTVFEGIATGASGYTVGEIVFNTSMTGYQEILTDPSYAGQIVTFTVPHIGNYGVAHEDIESSSIKVAGLVVRDMTYVPSNHRSALSLPRWLEDNDIVAIRDVDTRTLTRHIRDKGVMMAVIAHGATAADADEWRQKLEEHPGYGSVDYVAEVRCEEAMSVEVTDNGAEEPGEVLYKAWEAPGKERPHVVVLDFGVKHSILRKLAKRGLALTVVPGNTDRETIESLQPDGVLVSNGPGDPALLDDRLPLLRAVSESHPTFGICLGHQLLARAFGGETFKLPFGHRGPNQPVQDLLTGKVEMTSQNHGYAVKEEGLPPDIEVTHINLNDRTVEGFRHKSSPIFAVQYHPEAGPGPHDAEIFFDRFADAVHAAKKSQ